MELAKQLYLAYGITEWKEKSLVLSSEEQIEVLENLKNGVSSELVDLVHLPWPKFARQYFGRYEKAETYFRDPAFEYKMFFLMPSNISYFARVMRDPREITTVEYSINNIFSKEIIALLYTKLEDIPKTSSPSFHYALDDKKAKFVYLTQYIDLEEAKRLGLSITSRFENENADGYEFAKKMEVLNPGVREILKLYLGLEGEETQIIQTMVKAVGGSFKKTKNVLHMLIPLFMKTYAEFCYYLGYREEKQDSIMNYYGKKEFRDLDIAIETSYILKQIADRAGTQFDRLDEKTIEAIQSTKGKEQKINIAAACMYNTPATLANAMTLSIKAAQAVITKMNRQDTGKESCKIF